MTVTTIDIPADSLFGLDNLPYGVFSPREGYRVSVCASPNRWSISQRH
ncbi:hypothetical protein ACETU7_14890 [Rhodococcus sp. 3Y1]